MQQQQADEDDGGRRRSVFVQRRPQRQQEALAHDGHVREHHPRVRDVREDGRHAEVRCEASGFCFSDSRDQGWKEFYK